MAERLDWNRDGQDWPHREASSFVDAGGVRWHVQRFARSAAGDHPAGPAPVALLLHGTGASGHSWVPMLPWLGRHFDLICVDLPGHAFSSMPLSWQSSLPGMARAAGELMKALDARPDVVIGHSAGAALAARMCLDGQLAPKLLVSLNGAFLPLPGLAGVVFPPVAKVMAALPFAPSFFANQAGDPRSIDRLIDIVKEVDKQPGKEFEDGIKQAIATCLASPRFLFRVEIQPEPNTPEGRFTPDWFATRGMCKARWR